VQASRACCQKEIDIANFFDRRTRNDERKHRLNREIMAAEVRLNGIDNEPLGIVSIQEALRMSAEADVDLVEVAATADPPVCRLMDYGKFKYQEQKKAHDAKQKQKVIEVKEVKFRPGTTRARSRCVSAAVKSPTRNWACACWNVCATT